MTNYLNSVDMKKNQDRKRSNNKEAKQQAHNVKSFNLANVAQIQPKSHRDFKQSEGQTSAPEADRFEEIASYDFNNQKTQRTDLDDFDNVVQESPRISTVNLKHGISNQVMDETPLQIRRKEGIKTEALTSPKQQFKMNYTANQNSGTKSTFSAGNKSTGKQQSGTKQVQKKENFEYKPVNDAPAKVNFQQKALPLISWNAKKDEFELHDEARALVQNIKGPIAVLAVAGVYRTGKSFLLNRCLLNLQDQTGFGVGPTINPCTKGLWIWGTPIIGYTENGEQLNVLMLDTEGIGGLDEDNSHDMRLFTLSVLLSSYLIYNSIGSIDENALQSMSFVSHLSKYIQCKTEKDQDASDHKGEAQEDEHLKSHMPRFMWTVRDFTLQLVTDENKEMNAKEYLEKALEDLPDVGGSQTSKNEVKQNLRKYFPQRDCCTMVRPVVKEDLLQSLDTLPIENLRPEFVEQIINLRKKVMNGMKPKEINGQQMDGNLWVALVQQYLDAMNSGSIPSIESSWTYICQNKARECFETLKIEFESLIAREAPIPCAESDLLQCFEFYADKFKSDLTKGFFGEKDLQDQLNKQVDEYCASRFAEVSAHNLNECRQVSTNTLTQLFQELNSRFMADSSAASISQNIRSLELTFHEIWSLYDQNVPEYQEKCLIFLNGKAQFLNDLLYFVHATLDNDLSSVTKTLNELKDRNNSTLQETKEQSRLELQALESKLKETLVAKAELEANNELLKEQYDNLKSKKDTTEKEWQQKVADLKNTLQKTIDEQRQDKEQFEDYKQSMNRNNIKTQSEFEKERALLDQKVQFLEKNLAEHTQKEKQKLNSWQSLNKELSNQLRQDCQKYESELKQANMLLEEEREKSSELEISLQEMASKLAEQQEATKRSEKKFKDLMDQFNEQTKLMEQTTNLLGKDNPKDLKLKLKEKQDQVEDLTAKFKAIEEKSQVVEDELKTKLQQTQKDMAIKDQQLQFLDIHLKELKVQLEEANKQHQSMVEAMKKQVEEEEKTRRQGESEKTISQSPSRNEHLRESLENLQTQLNQAQEVIQELEIQLKLKESEAVRLQKELTNKVEDLEQQRAHLANLISSSEISQSQVVQELERKYKEDMQRYETELEDKQQSYESDIKFVQTRSEESLSQLKNFYEIEKDKLENRLRDEREKNQNKFLELHEEFEKKMRDEFSEKDEEIELLRDSLSQLEHTHTTQTTQVQHELTMKHQIIETLEKQLQDSRNRVELMESTRNQAFEKQLTFFESQRLEYNSKIDKLQNDNIAKDRQLAQALHKYERTVEDYERKLKDTMQTQQHLQQERDHLVEKYDLTKQKLSDVQDEAQQQQLIFGREQALSQQSIEFLERKIHDMQFQLEQQNQVHDEKMAGIKKDIEEDKHGQLERLQSEKDLWEQKFEQKRKALKEVEQQLTRENADLEKKLCLLQENFTRLDQEKRKQEAEYQERIAEAEAQINQLDSRTGEALYYGNAQAESIMQLKSNMQEYERQLQDLQSMYDKDKALWEGKCQFLETQKDNYKKDLNEMRGKFEITLEQLRKRGSQSQDKEHSQNAILKALEGKYKNQIKEMIDSHSSLQQEFINKSKRVEEENKTLNQELAVTKRETEYEISQLKSKLSEQEKLSQMLKLEAAELKSQLDAKTSKYQDQLRQEKDSYKSKLAEADRKNKELEQKKSQMMFEFEKDKAKWQVEMTNLLNQKRSLEETLSNLEKKREMLFKENERIKAERKASRSSVDGRTQRQEGGQKLTLGMVAQSITSTFAGSGLPPSSSATILKQKPGFLNQQSNNIINSSRTNLPTPLNLSMQTTKPPQPSKYSMQMMQHMNTGISSMYQQQQRMNQRYGSQLSSHSDENKNDDFQQDAITQQMGDDPSPNNQRQY